jgi:hypothetical protein
LAVFNSSLPSVSRGDVLEGKERCDGRTLADGRIAA